MKYLEFANVIERRIRQGDYTLRDVPSEDELAREAGLSRKTVRRGLLQLVEKGLLTRKPHGRLLINRTHSGPAGRFQLAFLSPAYSSPDWDRYRRATERLAAKFSASVRSVDFVHWDDPVITESLSNFDGVFLVPSSEPIPPAMLERFGEAGNIVALDTDLTQWSIPSVELMPPTFIQNLAEHLYELGHRRIDCFNTQPDDSVITRRIEQWQLWKRVRKVEGHMIDAPVEPYGDAMPHAYESMKKILAAGKFAATALVCLTEPAASGAARAIYERGLKLGKDISLCTFDGSRRGRYAMPSLTAVESPDPDAYLELCFEWLLKRNKRWEGPLLIQPTKVPLFVGESTGKVPKA